MLSGVSSVFGRPSFDEKSSTTCIYQCWLVKSVVVCAGYVNSVPSRGAPLSRKLLAPPGRSGFGCQVIGIQCSRTARECYREPRCSPPKPRQSSCSSLGAPTGRDSMRFLPSSLTHCLDVVFQGRQQVSFARKTL